MSNNEVMQSIEEIVENCELYDIDMRVIQKALTLNKKYGYT